MFNQRRRARQAFVAGIRGGVMAVAVLVATWSAPRGRAEDEKTGKVDDYNQWKQALGVSQATDPRSITTPPGFVVELLRSARNDEGSWISLTFDPRGRIVIAREDRGLLRLTVEQAPVPAGSSPPKLTNKPGTAPDSTIRVETVNDTLLECRGLLWAYDSLYVNANNSKGFYRLKYQASEDRFAEPELLRMTPGNVGHGRNDLVLGPDGDIYIIHGDDVMLPADYRPEGSLLRHYSDDRLLPCDWDNQLFNSYMKLPGGHVVRTDRDGKKWELVAGGLRNPYGLDFNSDGELFTYDADMEWDVGMPWYRPTRVLHLASGADFGWRRGTGTWRAWYPDSLPSAVDIGLGSPTAVKFGTHSHFPPQYRRVLFILDWAYGRILAVHLAPTGATYRGEFETFLTGRPLNVTDLEFGPDGAMYFLTGGRKTQSGLYRVRYVGPVSAESPPAPASQDRTERAAAARKLRHRLEAFHGRVDPAAIPAAWPHLSADDPWIRHAARVAVEQQPVAQWRDLALREEQPMAAVTALLALARLGLADDRDPIVARITALPWAKLTVEQRIAAARSLIIAIARLGKPNAAERTRLVSELELLYPDPSAEVNQLLCELLVALESPQVVRKTLPLVISAKTQEEKFHYLVTLRHVRGPWNVGERRTYVEWLRQSRDFYGAQYLPRYLQWLKTDVSATFTEDEKRLFTGLLAEEPPAEVSSPQIVREHVRNWQLDDLAGSLEAISAGRNFQRGQQTFTAALCLRCHRLGQNGSPVGPDLTEISRRFGRRDLLLSILAPSHVIDEKYRAATIVTRGGQVIVGQVLGDAATTVTVTPNLLFPESAISLRAAEIESQTPSLVSTMPAGLLNTFTKNEILDLLAYLEAAGKPDHPAFRDRSRHAPP